MRGTNVTKPGSETIHKVFVLFEIEKEGESCVFGRKGKDDVIRLPGLELTNGGDTEAALREHCTKKYGLTTTALKKYVEPQFKLWDEKIGRLGGAVAYTFYKALEFTGDFPPHAEFIPSQDVYDMIKKLKIDFKKT